MARLAGMTLRERLSGWKPEPFTSDSTKHVKLSSGSGSSSALAWRTGAEARPLRDHRLRRLHAEHLPSVGSYAPGPAPTFTTEGASPSPV
jgi:hypothetical protein